MSLRLATATVLMMTLAWPVVSATPAAANSPAKAHQYGTKRFMKKCKPPLKFAAGACVRRCPGGFRDTGRYCRFRNMSR